MPEFRNGKKTARNLPVRVTDTDGEAYVIDGECDEAIEKLRGKSSRSPVEHHMNERTLRRLNTLQDCYAHKVVGTVYARTGQPDIICCYKGRMYCLEGKTRNPRWNKSIFSDVRPHQRAALVAWNQAQARIGIYSSPDEAVAILEAFLAAEASGMPDVHAYWIWCDQDGKPELHHVDTIQMRD